MPAWQILVVFLLDLAFGDPPGMPHPVRLFGFFIAQAERLIRKIARSNLALFCGGAGLAIALTSAVFAGTWFLLRFLRHASPITALIVALYLAYSTLSVRGLADAGNTVVKHLQQNDLAGARLSLAMIVGRDTETLDEAEILRAVTETVAENCCDGVVAPMFYLSLGGAPAALTYKAINTLDSMIGYKNDRYFFFGKFAARLDDVANFIPARLTAMLVAFAACCLRLRALDALRFTWRDARLQPSPNSGYSEAAFAGALGIRLGGMNFYGGRPSHKAYLGELRRPITLEVFAEARHLFYATSFVMLACSFLISAWLWGIW
jgi:adenosylcobinamide-phosphate synthase